jgi:Trypsin-like peptidase domain
MSDTTKNAIRILKSIWNKNTAGVWIVHDMQEIDLKPRKGFDAGYFKIENNIDLMTQRPGPILQNLFATFGTTEFLVRQSIVPVVAWNEGDTEMRCIGTGFFVSASGLILTAGHVMRDPIDEDYTSVTPLGDRSFKLGDSLRFGVMLPANPAMRNAPFTIPDEVRKAKWFMCPFEWAVHWGQHITSPLFNQKDEFKFDVDIAVCKVRENIIGGSYQPLNIGPHSMKVGDRAVAIGYAEMRNIPFDGSDDGDPELLVSVGSVKQIFPDNITEKQTPTPGPCFEFDAKIPGKMSGSPILVGSGILAKGVVSRSWGGKENGATGCLVAPLLNLPLATGPSLLQLISSGNEGIANFRMSGI